MPLHAVKQHLCIILQEIKIPGREQSRSLGFRWKPLLIRPLTTVQTRHQGTEEDTGLQSQLRQRDRGSAQTPQFLTGGTPEMTKTILFKVDWCHLKETISQLLVPP